MPLKRDEVTGRVCAQGHACAHANNAQINNDIHVRYCFTRIGLLSSLFLPWFEGVLVCLALSLGRYFLENMPKQPKSKTAEGQYLSPVHKLSGFINIDIGSPQLPGSAKQVEGGPLVLAKALFRNFSERK